MKNITHDSLRVTRNTLPLRHVLNGLKFLNHPVRFASTPPMNWRGISFLLFAFCFLPFSLVYGQLSTSELPYSWLHGIGEKDLNLIPLVSMHNLDLETLKKEDAANDNMGGMPYRFGYSHKVSLTLTNSGIWETTSDGGRLWRLRIFSPDAFSIHLLYDSFWLPDGAKFFLYSEDMKQCIGAFTSRNNKGERANNSGFATEFLFTNSIVLEYFKPQGVSEEGIISITSVISGYRPIATKQEPDNPELGCFEDINCWEYAKNARDAVALMIIGQYSCSGALVNNTNNDYTPYFLSANHCFVDTIPTAQWFFWWNYETLECNDTLATRISTSGAELLAKRDNTDFMLLHLIEDPAENELIQLYYLGWDRTTTPTPVGIGIHHPRRMPKMITFVEYLLINNPDPIYWAGGTISPPNHHWLVSVDYGSVYKGSSGSPLILQAERIIGQLHGSGGFCSASELAYYGRFDISWDGTSASTRLRDWLDPNDDSPPYLDGLKGVNCISNFTNKNILWATKIVGCSHLNVQNVNIFTNSKVEMTARESISIKPNFHAQASSNVHFHIVSKESSSKKTPYLSNEAVFTNNNPMNIFGIKEVSTDAFQLFPNPATNTVTIEGEGIAQVEVYDVYGRKLLEQKAEGRTQNRRTKREQRPLVVSAEQGGGSPKGNGDGKFPSNSLEGWQPQADGVVITVSSLPAGVYLVKIYSENNQVVVKKLVITK